MNAPIPAIALNDGRSIPQLGLGTYKMPPPETADHVAAALELGYRHVDTASLYGNEEGVGEGLRRSGLDRDEVFITTKVWHDRLGYDETLRAFDESLERLGLEEAAAQNVALVVLTLVIAYVSLVLGDDSLYAEAGYTSITRGRLRNHVYVVASHEPDDPVADLRRALDRSAAKKTAIEQMGLGL